MRWLALAVALFVPPRKAKLGTEPTTRERLATDPAAPANRRPARPDG